MKKKRTELVIENETEASLKSTVYTALMSICISCINCLAIFSTSPCIHYSTFYPDQS
jgi:hypothetical protein